MPLIEKDENDLALLEIVEDPVWFGEWLRSSNDGAADKNEWPKRPFKYLWYQKDLLTDKNSNIVLTAGRAVGKCSPSTARIYTTDGYKNIKELLDAKQAFGVYALDENDKFVQRRARISPNGRRPVYKVTTKNGTVFEGTGNHPMLTPRGWIEIQDLKEDDRVAIVTKLPNNSTQSIFTWSELRYLGYTLLNGRMGPQLPLKLRFQSQLIELKQIAKEFDATFVQEGDKYRLRRKPGMRSYMGFLLQELDINSQYLKKLYKIPQILRNECNDNIKIFLEALLSYTGEITDNEVSFSYPSKRVILDIQEMLLRFGVETKIETIPGERWNEDKAWKLITNDYIAYYNLFQELSIPGFKVKNLPEPRYTVHHHSDYRFDEIASIELDSNDRDTYAVYVWSDHNYISDNFVVHNSIVLEDKIVHESVNVDMYFPETKEQLLTTANQAQIDPVLSRLILRFTNSAFLSGFLKGNINRSKGTFDFPLPGGASLPYRIYTRIAGKTGESNIVGLHIPRVKIDETQLYPMSAWTQLTPAINQWESVTQIFCCGVPSGGREGNVLYMLDQQNPNFKKYRIPGPLNTRWSLSEHMEAMRKYGGEESDDFLHLVLGQHGNPVFALIPYESIVIESFEIYSYRFTGDDIQQGRVYKDRLNTPKLDEKYIERIVLAIDTGYTDPTVIQLLGQDKNGVWRTLVRYRLTRIPFPEQANIIDWIATHYHVDHICIDLGAGGSGIAVMQDLMSDRFSNHKAYRKMVSGVRFNDVLVTGQDPKGNDLKMQAKASASQLLARMVEDKSLRFSELDMEGVSQLSRVASHRLASGESRYFVMSDRGAGEAKDDHIFASYIVFMIALQTTLIEKRKNRKRLAMRWG